MVIPVSSSILFFAILFSNSMFVITLQINYSYLKNKAVGI